MKIKKQTGTTKGAQRRWREVFVPCYRYIMGRRSGFAELGRGGADGKTRLR